MTTDFRALCAELVQAWDTARTPSDFMDTADYGVIAKIRAALNEPEPEGPSGDEIYKLALEGDFLVDVGDGFTCMVQDEVEFARAVLARWGRPAPQATVKDCLTDQSTDTQVAQLVRMLGDLAAEAELADQTRDVFVLDRAINMLKRLSLPQPS